MSEGGRGVDAVVVVVAAAVVVVNPVVLGDCPLLLPGDRLVAVGEDTCGGLAVDDENCTLVNCDLCDLWLNTFLWYFSYNSSVVSVALGFLLKILQFPNEIPCHLLVVLAYSLNVATLVKNITFWRN